MVNTGGEKVHTHEVEAVLLDHPAVTDAVVVGLPDDVWGEGVAAVVASPTAGPGFDEELRTWVRRTLAGYKVPRTVRVVPEMPRTPPASSSWPGPAAPPPARSEVAAGPPLLVEAGVRWRLDQRR